MEEAVIPRPPPSSTHWSSKFDSSLFGYTGHCQRSYCSPRRKAFSSHVPNCATGLSQAPVPYCSLSSNSDCLKLQVPCSRWFLKCWSLASSSLLLESFFRNSVLGTSMGLRSNNSPGGICALLLGARVWDAHVRGW